MYKPGRTLAAPWNAFQRRPAANHYRRAMGKAKEKEKEGLLPVRGLNILKADRRSGASPATQAWWGI